MNMLYNELLNGIDAVIFDMDGTLIDSMWIWKDIDIEYLASLGYEMPQKLQYDIQAVSFYEIALYFKKHFHIEDTPEEIMATWNRMAYEKYEKEVFLKPYAGEFLKKIREQGIRTGIATSNSRPLTMAVLRSNHVIDSFDFICSGDEVKNGKPHPDCYLLASEKLGVAPARCLVFEDTTFGLQAGISAGMRVCGVYDQYSFGTEEEMRAISNYYLKTWEELL